MNSILKEVKLIIEKNKITRDVSIFLYKNSYLKYKSYKENKNFLENGQKVLEQVDKVFSDIDVEYWLDFGTLLGAYRNKDFIKHDDDIDVAMWLKDYKEEYQKIFEKFGFKKKKEYLINDGRYGREETYEYLGVLVDIFYYTKVDNDKAYYHDFLPMEGKSIDKTIHEVGGLVPRELTLSLSGTDYIEFKGKEYPIPTPIEKHLSDRYGKDFMVENSSWSLGDEAQKNIRILEDKIGVRYIYK